MIEFGPSRCAGRIVTVAICAWSACFAAPAAPIGEPTQKPAAWPHINGSNETVDAVRLNGGVHEPAL
ncbi:hypothetical protein [Mesorhizobium sp. M0047]|uniref:hypothetical protein n=1 Tax=Mesorhizobium sp. M0047 TaxID=2956859 RepID=UPI0033369928